MFRLGIFLLFVFVIAVGLWACTGHSGDKFENLDSAGFASLVKENPDIQLLDVRTDAEYAQGHISGSKNIDIYDPDFGDLVIKMLNTDKPVAVYCKSGRRSRNAANLLVEKGYKVYNLDKGITGWVEDGMPTVK